MMVPGPPPEMNLVEALHLLMKAGRALPGAHNVEQVREHIAAARTLLDQAEAALNS